MTEATFVCGLVDNHSVVHVVSGVGDNSHNCVHTVGEVVQTVGVVERWSHNGRLTRLDAVQLVVGTVSNRGTWRTHGLFAHLALVHVTWRLVVVGEGGHVRDNREDVRGRELNMGRKTGNQVRLHTGNLHERLLERSDVIQLIQRQILNRAVHSR